MGNAFRRRRFAALSIMGAGVVLAAAVMLLASFVALDGAGARAELERRIAEATGRPVRVDGAVRYSLFPRPLLQLGEVRIGGGETEGPLLAVERIDAHLDLGNVLFGRMHADHLRLVRPELRFGPREAGVAGSDAAIDFARSLVRRLGDFRSVELVDGFYRRQDGLSDFSRVELLFDREERGGGATLAGTFRWNGQPVEIASAIDAPDAFLDGGRSGLRFLLAGPTGRIDFRGEGANRAGLELTGDVELATASLARAARWIAGPHMRLPEIGPTSLTAELDLGGRRLALRDVRLGIGSEIGIGALEARLGAAGRPVVAGTLAFPSLDLARIANGVAPLPAHALDLQRPIDVSFADSFDLDLRLSAEEAGLGRFAFRELAATVVFAEGLATLDVGDAAIMSGRAQGRLLLDLSRQRPTARGRIGLAGVDAGVLAEALGLDPVELTGEADLSAEFEAPATSWGDALRRNRADLTFRVLDGSVDGLSTLASAQSGASAFERRDAATPFSTMSGRLRMRGPYTTLEDYRIVGPDGVLEAGGMLSLFDRQLYVEGTFEPFAEEAGNDPFTTSQPVPFRMQGEWPEPTLAVGAATPPI